MNYLNSIGKHKRVIKKGTTSDEFRLEPTYINDSFAHEEPQDGPVQPVRYDELPDGDGRDRQLHPNVREVADSIAVRLGLVSADGLAGAPVADSARVALGNHRFAHLAKTIGERRGRGGLSLADGSGRSCRRMLTLS